MGPPETIDKLTSQIREELKNEAADRRTDAFLYNGGTALVLACTGFATYLDPSLGWPWLPKILSGLATFWIALDRALAFGPRWQHHMQMEGEYKAILVDLEGLPSLKDEEKPNELLRIRSAVREAFRRSSAVPGVGGQASNRAGEKKE